MKLHILLAGPVLPQLAAVSAKLDAHEFSTTLLASPRPLARVLSDESDTAALIVYLAGNETLMDFHDLFDARPGTAVVFLLDSFPPPAAIRRLVDRNAAVLLRSGECPLVVVATLVSLLAQQALAERCG